MVDYDDMDVFGEQITNDSQIANKYNMKPFVYQPHYQNIDVLRRRMCNMVK